MPNKNRGEKPLTEKHRQISHIENTTDEARATRIFDDQELVKNRPTSSETHKEKSQTRTKKDEGKDAMV